MKQTAWFERKFPPITDSGLLPDIIERLEGTPIRVLYKVSQLKNFSSNEPGGKWSIKKEVGHLLDLEPLWLKRIIQIIENSGQMEAADLTNRQTHEADHDERDIFELTGAFKESRQKLIDLLRNLKEGDLEKSALHPRLGSPMKIVDLAYFVAEHDDHHLVKITALSES